MSIDKIIELANEYNDCYLYYNGIEEFINEKNIEENRIDSFMRIATTINENRESEYLKDRILWEWIKNEVVKLVNGDQFCIIHRCPKVENYIQCSIFDSRGALGDFIMYSIGEIIDHLLENYRGFKFE